MQKENSVVLERVNGRENEYIIKDSTGITAGRIFIIEASQENRYSTLRIKIYREECYDLLKNALILLLRNLFSKKIYKVNILVDEAVDTKPFVDVGFVLEGVMEENTYIKGMYHNEFMFGITSRDFENNHRTNILRLKGKNVELRVLTPEDCEEILDYYKRNKQHLKNYEPARDEIFFTLDVQRKILAEGYKQFLNGTSINCGIYKENDFIGKIQMSNIVYGVFRSAFVGYSIDEQHQGKGYMKEALNLMLNYAFDDLELHRIEASTLVDNIKSQRVLKSCGFTEIGINKQYLFINGGWRDHVTFYKINEK